MKVHNNKEGSQRLGETIRKKKTIMAKWFGKGCKYQCNQWEENEETAGSDYKEFEPCLTFCDHKDNPKDTEGNCGEKICPINFKAKK